MNIIETTKTLITKLKEMDNSDGIKNKPFEIDDMNPFDIDSNFIMKD